MAPEFRKGSRRHDSRKPGCSAGNSNSLSEEEGERSGESADASCRRGSEKDSLKKSSKKVHRDRGKLYGGARRNSNQMVSKRITYRSSGVDIS